VEVRRKNGDHVGLSVRTGKGSGSPLLTERPTKDDGGRSVMTG